MKTFLRSIFAITSTVFMCVGAQAGQGTDVGIMLGVKDATFSTSQSGVTFSSDAGLMLGAIAVGEMGNDFYFRTGGYYAQRASKVNANGLTATLTFSYLDVPVTALYKFNDMFGVFGGATLGIKISDNCSGDPNICSGTLSVNSLVTAAQLGMYAKFHPNWSGEIFYEMGLGDVASNPSVSANSISADVQFIY